MMEGGVHNIDFEEEEVHNQYMASSKNKHFFVVDVLHVYLFSLVFEWLLQ